jgi:hypothetical protein
MAKKKKKTRKTLHGAAATAHAKKRARSGSRSRSIVVRKSAAPARRRSGGGGGRGGFGGLMPSEHELYDLAATGVYGWLEGRAKADPAFVLNQVPQFVTALGYSGNIALAARFANAFFPNQWLKRFATGAAHAAMYQLGRRGGLAKDTSIFTISGDHDSAAGDEERGRIEDDVMSQLAGEGADLEGYEDDLAGVDLAEPDPGT